MLRSDGQDSTDVAEVFQSLFWWIMVAKYFEYKTQEIQDVGFNPCSGGLWLLRRILNMRTDRALAFQSLFWWIMVAKEQP